MKRLLAGSLVALFATAAMAQDAGRITGFRVFVIWESSGQMSPDWSQQPQIVANDRKLGPSVQARVDVVLEIPRSGTMDDHTLGLSVRTGDGQTTHSLPVGFFASNRMIRSIIVTHNCGPFEVDAALGNSRRKLKVDLTCGG
jgi:hypothetical protein